MMDQCPAKMDGREEDGEWYEVRCQFLAGHEGMHRWVGEGQVCEWGYAC